MWLIDFVVMAPGGSICLISEKIIDINIKSGLLSSTLFYNVDVVR